MKKHLLPSLLGFSLLLAGISHFLRPDTFAAFFPAWVPYPYPLIYLSGVAELVLGTGLIWPASRRPAAALTILMLLAYLPLHVRDLLIDAPAIGSHTAAWVRLPIQGVLIAWAAYVYWQARPIAPSAE